MLSVPATLTLPSLIGITSQPTGCSLTAEQFARLGELLVQRRPQDSQAVCFLGGPLSDLGAGQRKLGAGQIVSLAGNFGSEPFLVIAGPQGALALLATDKAGSYNATMLTDPELVDRAALVLAQFGDYHYNLDAMCDPEAQRAFVSTVIVALAGEPGLRNIDLQTLLPDERRWIKLARHLAATPADTALKTPEVRQLIQESGITRVLLGQLDADQRQLTLIAADNDRAPARIAVEGGMLASVVRSRRSGAGNDDGTLPQELTPWLQRNALTALPLLRDGRVWGLLLAASERQISTTARATLSGLGALIIATVGASPAPSRTPASLPAQPRPAPAPPRATPPPAPAPAPSPTGDLRSRLAARTAAAPRPVGPSTQDLAALFEHLGDAVITVDAQGRLTGFTPAALQATHISPEAIGKSLVECGAFFLAPLLTDAITGDFKGSREVELPSGKNALVAIVAMDQGWAFILRTGNQAAPAVPVPMVVTSPAVSESERNENFLANFSNIIRVPLRELRNLITSVPAAGTLNEQQSRLIGEVVKLNSELTMLVNDLLALGQIRLQSNEHRVPLRLDLLLDAAVGTQYAEFGRRGQHVSTDIPPAMPRILGSEEGLGRAVTAILDNAIKYSPAGAQIDVAMRREQHNLRITIHNTGTYLTDEECAQVFDPFYRAPSSDVLGVSGRGLGLTIAKAVIEQHDGHVTVASDPQQGTTFTMSLPCEG